VFSVESVIVDWIKIGISRICVGTCFIDSQFVDTNREFA